MSNSSFNTTLISKFNPKRAASLGLMLGLMVGTVFSPARVRALDHMHTLSPSYHAAVIESESADTYVFHAPGISYNGALGRTFGCRIRLAVFFPVHLFQDGQYFHARDYYSTTLGGEALLGAAYTFRFGDGQTVTLDVGSSIVAAKLGSDAYESFYNLTFGFGAGVEYTYPLNHMLVLGTFLSVSGHFLDLIHETDGLQAGAFVTAGISLGLTFEGSVQVQ